MNLPNGNTNLTQIKLPALWLITFIAGLTHLTETIYSPSLPQIAIDLNASDSQLEYTLTIFLFGFAIGVLCWGVISDLYGRKPCVIAGLVIYIIGCMGCFFSETIEILMLSRFIQAFGGAIGSVLTQAICRDAFHGPALGKAYSIVGSALGIFPAVGPVIGGLIAVYCKWSAIFLVLIVLGVVNVFFTIVILPETLHRNIRQKASFKSVFLKMVNDSNVLVYCLIITICNGITFSFYAEGSFYLIEMLKLTPFQYGLCYIPISIGMICGGYYSKRLNQKLIANHIVNKGIKIIFFSSMLFSILISVNNLFVLPDQLTIIITVAIFTMISFGICMTTSNCLALALVNYKSSIGSASSLFGFAYYMGTSFVTFGMGALHNGTLLMMPLYFLILSASLFYFNKKMILIKNSN